VDALQKSGQFTQLALVPAAPMRLIHPLVTTPPDNHGLEQDKCHGLFAEQFQSRPIRQLECRS
jgi:hypothetical protein